MARHDLTLGTGKSNINSSQASTSFQQLPVRGGDHHGPPRALHFQPPCLAQALPIASHPGPIGTLPGRRFPLPAGSPCNFPLPRPPPTPVTLRSDVSWVLVPLCLPRCTKAHEGKRRTRLMNNETTPKCHFLAVQP